MQDTILNIRFLFIPLLICVFYIQPLSSQEVNKDWQNEKNHLERAIANTSLLINETRISKQSTLDDLTLINNQVSNRQKLVNSLIREQEMYKDTIFTLLLELDNLSNELEALKEEYTKLIYYANKNRNYYQRLLYIMAAEDFLQAYRRLNYFKQYATQRKEYVTLINEAEKKYSAKVGDLEKKVTLNQEILTRVKYELNNLDAAKALKSTAINNLGQKEKELVENQEKLQNDVDELNKKIEEIVAEEMSQASENNGSGRENPNHSTPEEDIISKSFASNKGRLPWPSKSGVISSGYGEHKHPDLKWVRVRNNGINIVTPRGSKARAVFGGAVTRVLSVPNFNNVVIIRHGEYLSVYSNLDVVYVKTGDNIDIKSEIGTIHTNGTLESYELHFEIWKGKTLLNPEEWLAIPKPDGMTQTDAP